MIGRNNRINKWVPFLNTLLSKWHIRPELYAICKTEIPKWEADPILNVRHKLIIEKKRQEWIDRENNRKLVD